MAKDARWTDAVRTVAAQAGTFARVRVTAGGVTKTIGMRPGA